MLKTADAIYVLNMFYNSVSNGMWSPRIQRRKTIEILELYIYYWENKSYVET
jgi:hypothetical protein